MDIMFRNVKVEKISGTSQSASCEFLDVHLDCIDEDDLCKTIGDSVSSEVLINEFLATHLDALNNGDKEEILESIGVNFVKGYFELTNKSDDLVKDKK